MVQHDKNRGPKPSTLDGNRWSNMQHVYSLNFRRHGRSFRTR